jgi:antitoxin CptB
MPSAVERNRLRWRCRRGMLENDLVLERFLRARDGVLDVDETAALDRLLDLPDQELWHLVSGQREPDDPALAPLVRALREA